MNADTMKLARELEHDRDRLLLALVRATEQGVQRFGMENEPTLSHSFISAWENAFPLLVEFGVATECDSDVEILVDEAKVNAIEDRIDNYVPSALSAETADSEADKLEAAQFTAWQTMMAMLEAWDSGNFTSAKGHMLLNEWCHRSKFNAAQALAGRKVE